MLIKCLQGVLPRSCCGGLVVHATSVPVLIHHWLLGRDIREEVGWSTQARGLSRTCPDMCPVFCACALFSSPWRRRSRLCWHLGSSFLSCSRTRASHRIVSDLYTLPCAGPHFLAWISTPLVHGSSVLHLGLLRVRHVRVKDRTLCGRSDVKFSECSISRRPCITDSLARGFSCAVNPFLFCRATTEDGFQQVLLPAEPEGDWCNLVLSGKTRHAVAKVFDFDFYVLAAESPVLI